MKISALLSLNCNFLAADSIGQNRLGKPPKTADEVVFRDFQGEGVEFFFKSDLTDPPQIFDAHLLENTD